MLEALRSTVGPQAKIRLDPNQSWSIPQARKTLEDWHARFDEAYLRAGEYVPYRPAESD